MTQAIVYQAVNLVNGKRYVGATEKTLHVRKTKHLANARRGQLGKFYTAIRSYGPENFHFTALASFPNFSSSLDGERYFIARLKPEYNLTEGGGGVKGHKMSDESKAKMRAAKIGKKGHPCPEWLKRKNAELRRSEKGKVSHPSARRPVECVTRSAVFQSVTDAARAYGINAGEVVRSAKGEKTIKNGLRFRYIEVKK